MIIQIPESVLPKLRAKDQALAHAQAAYHEAFEILLAGMGHTDGEITGIDLVAGTITLETTDD